MGNFDDKKMIIYEKDSSKETFEEVVDGLSEDFDGYVFYSLFRDPIGNSGGNPTWGDLYYKGKDNSRVHFLTKCIYKCLDYDEMDGPYAEKLWSMLGKRVLTNGTRIPEITLIKDSKYNDLGIASHIILDNNKEDMQDIRTLLFFKYDRQDMVKMKSVYPIEHVLEAIKMQIGDEANYKEVEKQVLQAILLDAMTNNADRHAKNWSLIRDKRTNRYTLGLFDHSSSFLDMISERPMATGKGYWSSTYLKIKPETNTYGLGESGDKIAKYVVDNYPEIAKEFCDNFANALPEFFAELEEAPTQRINVRRIKSTLTAKKRILEKMVESRISGDEEKGGNERD